LRRGRCPFGDRKRQEDERRCQEQGKYLSHVLPPTKAS
jgi:hypothetical protein